LERKKTKMGLDMYLSAKKHFAKINWQALQANDELTYNSPEAVYPKFNDLMELTQLSNVATDIYGASVEVTCAYWRKANQVHAWFVREVQKGNDNCGEYYVSQDKLKELRDLCQKALDTRDPNLLPPQDGFFFGGTDIDEWYWQDLKNTITQLDKIFALPQLSDLSFSYNSSW
jgi:hypothetical protein